MSRDAAGVPEPLYYRIYGPYGGEQPRFLSVDDEPFARELEEHWETIRREFVDYHYDRGQSLTPSFIPDPVEVTGWQSINFFTYLRRYHANCAAFPKTVALLESIPNVTSAFINLLEPHSRLPRHNGDSNAIVRCHLPLIVPGDETVCGMEVDGERRGWDEGKVLAFTDAHSHWVWNETDRDRVILVCDVMRPEYAERKWEVCSGVLGAISVAYLQAKLPWLARLPGPATRALHRLLSAGFRVYLPLQRRLRLG